MTTTNNPNVTLKNGCGHLGDLNHVNHVCSRCAFADEEITHPECRNCSITLNLPTKRCYFEI